MLNNSCLIDCNMINSFIKQMLGRGKVQEKAIAQLAARSQERQEALDAEDRTFIMTAGTLFREQLDAVKREGLDR
jgi:hypothetical protein